MHQATCACSRCQHQRGAIFPVERFGGGRPASVMNEADEVELAMELLGVSNEAEWEQFLGKMFKGIGRGLKKVGGKLLKPLGGALKGLAKKALPMLGGALGTLIPIPGVGTALGTALGSAVGKALEMEFGEAEAEESEFEIARRIVRIAGSAAQQLAGVPDGVPPEAAVRRAMLAAARAHVPGLSVREGELTGEADEYEYQGEEEDESGGGSGGGRAMSGRWQRRGRAIVLLGA